MNRLLIFTTICLLIAVSLVVSSCDYITGAAIEAPISSQRQQVIDVTAAEAFDLIQENTDNPDFIIIDVRTLAEYDSGHIVNAVLVSYNPTNFKDEISKYDRNKEYLIYCQSGTRSKATRDIMEELGLRYVYNMKGGITEWLAENMLIVK